MHKIYNKYVWKKVISLLVVSSALSLSVMADAHAKDKTFKPKPLDGVFIKAVENYNLPEKNQLLLGVGYWPTDAYYNAFAFNLNYIYHFNRRWSWEVVKGSYLLTVDKDLTHQLAEDFGVNPDKIERLSYGVSSNLVYYNSYGKFIYSEDQVRYFRIGFLFGGGLIGSEDSSEVVPSLGVKMEVYRDSRFSWVISLHDYISIERQFENILSVEVGTAFSF